ncbi:MAG: HD family hydrolase [Notoacmeibacter sp.]|nr:HD family hydrolase [Notoacmeibacter sp.]
MSPRPTARQRADTRSARAWQRMLSGRRLDLLDPAPLDIEIADIAHGLARVARWNGQTKGAHIFSVAQHTLLVEAMARRRHPRLDRSLRLAILLHDAAEYVIGDMISPFKAVVGGGYKAVELRLQAAIHLRFSLPAQLPAALQKAIKRADQIAAWFEARELAGFGDAEAAKYFGRPRGITGEGFDLEPKPAKAVESQFLSRFHALEAACGTKQAALPLPVNAQGGR